MAPEKRQALTVPLIQAYNWFDSGMQSHLKACGWPQVTRAQSMILDNIIAGEHRATRIAKNLGLSRQAVHHTLLQLVEMGLIEIRPDPNDGRSKLATISRNAQGIQEDAYQAADLMETELAKRIGPARVKNLIDALTAEWGPPIRSANANANDENRIKTG